MVIRTIKDIHIDERDIAEIDVNGRTFDIHMFDRGVAPVPGDNYLAIRAYGKSVEPSDSHEMYVKTEVAKTERGYATQLSFCGRVADVHAPESIVDPYFNDLQLNKIIHISTPDLDFDIDGFTGSIPEIGSYVCGTADFSGTLISKEKAAGKVKSHNGSTINAFMGSYTSPCTVITNKYIKNEALHDPEKFLSYVLQGKEEFAMIIFNKGADLIGCEHFSESDFRTTVFPIYNGNAIGSVIKLPDAEEEFDYSVIALEVYRDVSKSAFYMLEKGDETAYLLRKADRSGSSGTVSFVSGEEDHFEYVCNYLRG